ncbi:microtubule-associated protein futsch-like [Parasteatoda tepidariorum]|uniref:microtubule-associated protein futsch-like n=1 Tax=Parasteatoda tepidariorum TaxID=114398 RepID=UPI0039BD393B
MSNIPTTKQYELKYITYKAFSVFDVRRWGTVSSRVARYGKQTSSRLVTYGKQTSGRLVTYGKETSGRLITYGGHLYRQTLDSLGSTVYQRVKGFWVSDNDEPCSRTGVEETSTGCRCLLCRAQQSGHQLTVVRDVHGRYETNSGPSGSWIFVPNLAESGVETSHQTDSMDNTVVLNSESSNIYPKTIEGAGINEQLAVCSLSCPQSAAKCSSPSAAESFSRSETENFIPENTLRSAPENFSRSGREIFIPDGTLQSILKSSSRSEAEKNLPKSTLRSELESSFRSEAESFLPEGTLRSVPETTAQLEVKSNIQSAAKSLKSKTESIQQASAKNTRKSESVRNQESQTKRIKSETGSSQQTSTKRTFQQEVGSCPLCSAKRTLGSDEGSSLQSASKRPFIVEGGGSQQSIARQITRSAAIETLQFEAKSPSKRSPKPTKRASKSPLLKPRQKRAK